MADYVPPKRITTDRGMKALKPLDKAYRVSIEKGLYVQVNPTGKKCFRQKYRFDGKEKLLSHGVYPETSFGDAIDECLKARVMLKNGIDPSKNNQAKKKTKGNNAADSFEVVAREWYAKQLGVWKESTTQKRKALLENDFFPWIGKLRFSEITTATLLDTLDRMVDRGAIDKAHNGRQVFGQIFRYARATGRCDHYPEKDLKGALPPKKTTQRPAFVEPEQVRVLLKKIDRYDATLIVRSALALCPLLFQRPGEMISMEWCEIDLETAEWRIPAEKMKMSTPHIVPLPGQAITILKDLQPLTGQRKYVFPNQRSPRDKHISAGTINKALQNMGFNTKTEHCAHGFRAMARTMLDEQLGFRVEWIEQQLNHKVRDPLGRAYNRTKHLPQRHEMMQKWADYLDTLRHSPATK